VTQVRKQDDSTETVATPSPSPAVPPGEAVTVAPATGSPVADIERPNVPGFEIVEELGRGGMGVVYKARQVSLNRFVALKMILAGPYAGVDQLARFRIEAEAVARLQHPGIVQIHEISSHAGHSYLALEYVAGGTLTRKCAAGPLSPVEAAQLGKALARTVQYAHQRGIIHRDLKPGNVLLADDGQPKITDFGLAKLLDSESGSATPGPQTQSGAILGTPAYMAPEQAGGKRGAIGPAADVYALGAILYELLTGRPPFQADTPVDVILKAATEEPVPPRRLAPGCPRDLETVCLKCLHKKPEGRYSSAQELADDLGRFLAAEPTLARPQSVGERFRRWAWRRRWRLIGGTVLVGMLLLLVVSLAFNAFAVFFLARGTSEFAQGPEPTVVGTPIDRRVLVSLPADLDLVPRDAILFVSVRVADLWKRRDVQEWNRVLKDAKYPNLDNVFTVTAKNVLLPRPRAAYRPDVNLDDRTVLAEKLLALGPDAIERATLVLANESLGFVQDPLLFLATVRPYVQGGQNPLQIALEKRGHRARKLKDRTFFNDREGKDCVCFVNNRVIVYSPHATRMAEWIEQAAQPGASRPLRPALELAADGQSHLVAGMVPPRSLRDQLLGQAQVQPPGVGPGSGPGRTPGTGAAPAGPPPGIRPDFRPLAEVLSARLTVKLKSLADGANVDGLEVDVRLSYQDGAASQKGFHSLVAAREFLAGAMRQFTAGGPGGVPPVIAQEGQLALRTATVKQEGTEGHVHLTMEWAPDWPADAVGSLNGNKDWVRSSNNLKEIFLALFEYQRRHGHLPPAAICDKAGKPRLSWRVAILPTLGQDNLYKQFRLDEPWDSEHNKKLIEKMPDVYSAQRNPADRKPGYTYYQVFVGEQTPFPPDNKTRRLSDFKDRERDLLMVVEAGDAVQWTRPTALAYDPGSPLPALGGIFHDFFQVLFADGSVRRFPSSTPTENRHALITGKRLP
jgi:hypothetical protein